jgi:flavin reductase (DIM6/NTAB) family NADH-FMN oxidoreductase RutF
MADAEKHIKRNPHGNFKEVEASRPEWDSEIQWGYTQTKKPSWKAGDGANDDGASLSKSHIDIDPYEEGRPAAFNYKLLISGIIPRPVGFVSTRSADGTSTNLAPFSYFSVVNHDPPIFTVGFSGGFDKAKDSLRNLKESGECVLNIISEHYLEAANSTSVNAPYGTSEWALSGLTPAPCKDVKASRVKEAVFSVEGKLVETKEFESRSKPGEKSGVLAIIEGVRFWAREDAINEDKNLLDPAVRYNLSAFLLLGKMLMMIIGIATNCTPGWHHLCPCTRRHRNSTAGLGRAQDRRCRPCETKSRFAIEIDRRYMKYMKSHQKLQLCEEDFPEDA